MSRATDLMVVLDWLSHGIEVDVPCVSATASDVQLHPFVMEEIGSARSECYVCFLAVEVVNPSMFGNNVVLLQSFIVGSIMIAAFGCARIPPPPPD